MRMIRTVLLLVCLWGLCHAQTSAGSLEERNAAAAALAATGKLDKAIDQFQRNYELALKQQDEQQAAHAAAYIGTLYRFQGQAKTAIPFLRAAKRRLATGSSDRSLVIAQLGMALAQAGQMELAERELRSGGNHPAVQVNLAAVLLERGFTTEAELLLGQVLREPGTGPAWLAVQALAHLCLARVFQSTARASEADRFYRMALDEYAELPVQPHPDRLQAAYEYSRFLSNGVGGMWKSCQ
jgi:tetratricopeptide (TPR) repeat protein